MVVCSVVPLPPKVYPEHADEFLEQTGGEELWNFDLLISDGSL